MKKIISISLTFLFVLALGLTSCSSSKKAKRCPAYGGDIKKMEQPSDKIRA